MSIRLGFNNRHIGPHGQDRDAMLASLGYSSLEALVGAAVPAGIRLAAPLAGPEALPEHKALAKLQSIMGQNRVLKSFIGQGYYGTLMPTVIQRNILENPGWYTAYTPYQAEIAQGRLEALLNFQTMITDLTKLDVANASLLDEGTAAAEAMALALAGKPKGKVFFVSDRCHPQTIDVVVTRAEPLGIEVRTGDWENFDPAGCAGLFGVLVQYPDTRGRIDDFKAFFAAAKFAGAATVVACDLLALTVLRPPGEFGADICVGSAQRFGVPLGFGGPHAGFMSCKDEMKRKMPGRIIGVSVDARGKPGFRLSLQTREQHIRRDKATSNICTAQVLLAVLASMYAVYHGPDGLRYIANRIHRRTVALKNALTAAGIRVEDGAFFDTIVACVPGKAEAIVAAAEQSGINLRLIDADHVGVSYDETTTCGDAAAVAAAFGAKSVTSCGQGAGQEWPEGLARSSAFLTQKVFNSFHAETEMLRYLKRLETKDLALNESMIALGSCTMKLNATSEMIPLSWPEVALMHPFVPASQCAGYREMLGMLEGWLAEITGFDAVSLQPNAGSQGEYAGLLAIRRYHQARGEGHRNVCLIPVSAHGTNPASAVMAGMKVVGVKCDAKGNIEVADLVARASEHRDHLAALMVTYPSTHGVFEETIREICGIIHEAGGQVYMDGANMNAQVGLTSPGAVGADVCHLNLHKTFAIPHGGGGPGVGPIGVAKHLTPYLPGHRYFLPNKDGAVSSAPWGSGSINTISWMYIAMMGAEALTEATATAILNANYVAKRLAPYYPVLYTGNEGLVAHECIIDVRPLSEQSGVTVEDVAKRLMDYGFHAPTMSWPVAGTLMIEPTESESKCELDRFCEAMISIHGEITAIIRGDSDDKDNPLKNAPHPVEVVCGNEWTHPYSREDAAFPLPYLRQHKFWPAVARIDNVAGDRNLVCTCDSVEAYAAGA